VYDRLYPSDPAAAFDAVAGENTATTATFEGKY